MESKDLFILASMIPEGEMIKMLKKSITEYENAVTGLEREKAHNSITAMCMMLLSKDVAPTVEDAIKQANEMDDIKRTMDLFKVNKN